jgi:hydrogenase-4 component B
MIFVGAAIKAGLWPFHIWIPHVYAEAPATVAALMSGIKIKLAIYIMIRILIMQHCSNANLGFSLIALGTISALWGILFA